MNKIALGSLAVAVVLVLLTAGIVTTVVVYDITTNRSGARTAPDTGDEIRDVNGTMEEDVDGLRISIEWSENWTEPTRVDILYWGTVRNVDGEKTNSQYFVICVVQDNQIIRRRHKVECPELGPSDVYRFDGVIGNVTAGSDRISLTVKT